MKHFFYIDVLFTWKFSSTILLLLFAKKWIWFPVFKFCLFGELVDWRGRDHGDMIFPSLSLQTMMMIVVIMITLLYLCYVYTHFARISLGNHFDHLQLAAQSGRFFFLFCFINWWWWWWSNNFEAKHNTHKQNNKNIAIYFVNINIILDWWLCLVVHVEDWNIFFFCSRSIILNNKIEIEKNK